MSIRKFRREVHTEIYGVFKVENHSVVFMNLYSSRIPTCYLLNFFLIWLNFGQRPRGCIMVSQSFKSNSQILHNSFVCLLAAVFSEGLVHESSDFTTIILIVVAVIILVVLIVSFLIFACRRRNNKAKDIFFYVLYHEILVSKTVI